MKFKKPYIIILTAAVLLSLTGCKKEEEPQQSDQPALCSALGSTQSEQYYLKLFGIEGGCKIAKYMHWIEVLSYSIEEDSKNEGWYLLTFSHYVDKATPRINECARNGSIILDADFAVSQTAAGKLTEKQHIYFEKLKIKDWYFTYEEQTEKVIETVIYYVYTVTYENIEQ